MDGRGSESLPLQAWLENSETSDNANEGNKGDHADSGPKSSTGQKHWLYKVPEIQQEATQGDEAGEGGERPRSELPRGCYEVEAIGSQWVREDIQIENLIKWLDRPTLPEGYYYVEAILDKREWVVRKQYLIKWLDWPEKDNTWESLANLRNVRSLIDAFEESIKSPKLRKRKGKRVAQRKQIKRHQHSRTAFSPRQFASLANVGNANAADLSQAMASADEADNNGNANIHVRNRGQIAHTMEEDKFDPLLLKPKASSSTRATGVDANGLAFNVQSSGNRDINQKRVEEDNLDIVEIIKPIRRKETNTGKPLIFFAVLRLLIFHVSLQS